MIRNHPLKTMTQSLQSDSVQSVKVTHSNTHSSKVPSAVTPGGQQPTHWPRRPRSCCPLQERENAGETQTTRGTDVSKYTRQAKLKRADPNTTTRGRVTTSVLRAAASSRPISRVNVTQEIPTITHMHTQTMTQQIIRKQNKTSKHSGTRLSS